MATCEIHTNLAPSVLSLPQGWPRKEKDASYVYWSTHLHWQTHTVQQNCVAWFSDVMQLVGIVKTYMYLIWTDVMFNGKHELTQPERFSQVYQDNANQQTTSPCQINTVLVACNYSNSWFIYLKRSFINSSWFLWKCSTVLNTQLTQLEIWIHSFKCFLHWMYNN